MSWLRRSRMRQGTTLSDRAYRRRSQAALRRASPASNSLFALEWRAACEELHTPGLHSTTAVSVPDALEPLLSKSIKET